MTASEFTTNADILMHDERHFIIFRD